MTRRHNERFRGRDEITVYGRRAVAEALAEPTVEILRVAVAREAPASLRAEIETLCRARAVEPERLTLRQVNEISADPRKDQGVAARVRLSNVEEVDAWIEENKGSAAARPARLLALDGVTNPQNVGMIVRSALAAGITGVLWPRAGSPWVSGLIIKASAATLYRARIVTCPTLEEGLWALRRAGFSLCGLVMRDGTPLYDFRCPHRAALIVGGETEGLSPAVDGLLDERITIPMHAGVESLNAAVAASLVCFWAAHAPPARG